MKKTWILALLVGFSAMSLSCSDDAGDKSKDEPQEQTLTYALSCVSPSSCKLELEEGQQAVITVQLKSKDATGTEMAAANAAVSVVSDNATLFSMQNQAGANLAMTTDTMGLTAVLIKAGDDAGTGKMTFSVTTEGITVDPLAVEIVVTKKPEPEPEPTPTEKDVAYTIKLAYVGDAEINSAEAFMVAGKTCAAYAPTGLTAEQVAAIAKTSLIDSKIDDPVNAEYKITTKETEEVRYAVIARAKSGSAYIAYGCEDGVSQSNSTVTVDLDDVLLGPGGDEPDVPVIPDDPELTYNYSGKYTLRSQYNALSLLPHADKPESGVVLFKDMEVGDWIEFSLDFLSVPEKEINSVLTDQLMPLLLNADWLKNLISKVVPGLESILTPEMIQMLYQQFQIDKVITDLLKQLTGQVEWWGTATSIVKIINDLATNFTMEGSFYIATTELDANNKIAGIGHRYNSLIYNNGAFEKCVIGSKTEEHDADGNTLCRVSLAQLDADSSSINGAFTAQFSNPAQNAPEKMQSVDILTHSMQLNYGKLIYAALMEVVPQFIKPENGAPVPQTLAGILEYYVGYGLKELWNKDNPEDPITSSSCTAVGDYVFKLANQKLPDSLKSILTMFGASAITLACTTGVNSLDKLINEQIEKLSVSSDKVTFSSNSCAIAFDDGVTMPSGNIMYNLAVFGQEQAWGSSAKDNRCDWNISITTTNKDGEQKMNTIKGKYWAERIMGN